MDIDNNFSKIIISETTTNDPSLINLNKEGNFLIS